MNTKARIELFITLLCVCPFVCPYKSNYKFDKPRKGGDSQRLAFLEFLLEPKKVHLKAKGAKLFKVFLKTLRESSVTYN